MLSEPCSPFPNTLLEIRTLDLSIPARCRAVPMRCSLLYRRAVSNNRYPSS